jgi:hypothetical protein
MEETAYEETRVDAKVRAAISGRGKLETMWGHTLYHIDDLPFTGNLSDLPDVFTPFKNKVESNCSVRDLLPTPTVGQFPVASGMPATAVASWEQLPLASEVKAGSPPAKSQHAVLDFQVCPSYNSQDTPDRQASGAQSQRKGTHAKCEIPAHGLQPCWCCVEPFLVHTVGRRGRRAHRWAMCQQNASCS